MVRLPRTANRRTQSAGDTALGKLAGWLAEEYPLGAGQEVVREADGAAVVCAEVAGLVEAARWGKNATALEPKALRDGG